MHVETHDFPHMAAANAIVHAAPTGAIRDLLAQIWTAATSANIPWNKIFMAFATMAAGGFSPMAIASGLAILFGSNVPPALKTAADAAAPQLEAHAEAVKVSMATDTLASA